MTAQSSDIDREIADTSMGRPHLVILGAGASLAAFPNGDRNGRQLPLMNDFVDVLELGALLESCGINYDASDFEALYADLCDKPDYNDLRLSIEQKIHAYFSSLQIPDDPTIYDHLVLSLRGKDLIATFNWDPLLFQACVRNHGKIDLPKVAFLHGNVATGYCKKDKTAGALSENCRKCGGAYTPSRLLYPVKTKDYSRDPFINAQWNDLRRWLKGAFMLTIFGYSGPASDVEAIDLMKRGWGQPNTRNYEQIEIIDVKGEEELLQTWDDFIHTHHYEIYTSFYDSWNARHPRRTCEAMWNQNMENEYLDDNKLPVGSSFEDLWDWLEPLKAAELENKTSHQ